MGNRIQRSLWQRVVAVTWIASAIVFVVYDYLANSPKAQSVENDLKQEFAAIMPLPGAVRLSHGASHRPREAWIASTYSTSQSYSEIRRYYDQELAQHGWAFHREEKFRDWGRDFGGRTVNYCKSDYEASLHYAGERARYGWDFGLDLRWRAGEWGQVLLCRKPRKPGLPVTRQRQGLLPDLFSTEQDRY